MTIQCPDCQQPIAISQGTEVGEIIECQNCGAEMEIVSLKPLKVELILEEK